MRTRTEVLLCQLPGHSVQAQGPTEASASDHTQPISCNHSRSVGTTLEHAPQGRGKPVGRPQRREARGLQEADWHVNNHGSHAAQEGPGCIARMVLRDYFVNSALGHHICSLSKWMQLLMTWGALFLPSGGFPLLSARPWQALGCMGCLYGWDTRTWVFPFMAAPPASRCELNAPCDPSPLPLLNSCFKNSLMRGLLAQLEVFIKTH